MNTSPKSLIRSAIAGCMLSYMSVGYAIPIQLNSTDFATALSGAGSVVVEDFESFTSGAKASPFVIANGTFTSAATPSIDGTGFICSGDATKCLITSAPLTAVRTFDGFGAGTNLWSTDLFFVNPSTTNIFDVTVTGVSGVLSFQVVGSTLGGFLGFSSGNRYGAERSLKAGLFNL